MAFLVLAWNFTSLITGSESYLPVPIISRRHFQGIFSLLESGVCPNSSRNFRDGFFLRLRTLPRSMTTSCFGSRPGIRIEKCRTSPRLLRFLSALA
jgi:hypothetical protein